MNESETNEPTDARDEQSPLLSPSPEQEGNTAVACANHPRVKAEAKCSRCDTPICKTCAFTYPNNLVFCPSCATAKLEVMTPKRRKGRLISFIMAGIATCFLVLIFGGLMFQFFESMPEEDYETFVGFLFIFLILVPAVVGFSFGIGTLNKRRGNPISILAPTIWNGILIGIWVFLTIVGLFA